MIGVGCKRKRVVGAPSTEVDDLDVLGNLTVAGTSTLTGQVDVVNLYASERIVIDNTAKLALEARATVPTPVGTSTTMYTDDGTNSNCGVQTLRMNSETSAGSVDMGADFGPTWGPGLFDSSGNAFTQNDVDTECTWSRSGPHLLMHGYITYTSTAGTTAGDLVRLTGLPLSLTTPAGPRQYSSTVMMSGVTWPATAKSLMLTYLASNNYARLSWDLGSGSYQDMKVSDVTGTGFIRWQAMISLV